VAYVHDSIYQRSVLTQEVAVPKRHSIFRFEIPQPSSGFKKDVEGNDSGTVTMEAGVSVQARADVAEAKPLLFDLHGSQFESRATDRTTKKFKQRRMDGL
jgi:ribonuclease P protein subunit POP4